MSRQSAIAEILSGMPHLTIINDEPLDAQHLMRTAAHVGSNGHLTAVTPTCSVVLLAGFHGAVQARVYDADGGEDTQLLGDGLNRDEPIPAGPSGTAAAASPSGGTRDCIRSGTIGRTPST